MTARDGSGNAALREALKAISDADAGMLALVVREYAKATAAHGPFHSAHEGYAVLYEEVDELWEEVRKKSHLRTSSNLLAMRGEAKQVAAMALRFMTNLTADLRPRGERMPVERSS